MGYLRTLASAFLGRPVAFMPSGYNAAGGGRRTLNIGTSSRSVSSLALSDGASLVGRARKAAMDNPLAANAISAFIAEVIGTGLRPHSRHSNPDTRRQIEKEFNLWIPQSSAARRQGSDGKPDSLQNFFAQQMLVCRNVIEAGEAFGRLRPRFASDLSPMGLRVPLQIDLIEPEQLAWWRMSGEMASPRNLIRGGIEFDPSHTRVAYHFYREHPGDGAIWPNTYDVVRVPSQSIVHVMEFIRGNQIRGITALAPILIQLADLDDYDDAERFRQKLGAYLFGWRKSLSPDDPLNAPKSQSSTSAGTSQAPAGAAYVDVQPGTLNMLDTNDGEEFDFYAHPGVPQSYQPFMRIQRETISTVLRVTYDMLTGDMTQVNYSSARVRLIAIRRQWRQFQQAVIEHQFCRPVWRAWLDSAALAGIIDASDYAKNPEEYLNVEWLPQPWEWVDPVKDITSLRMSVESAFTSREAVVTSLGRDVEEVDAEIGRDHEREARLGIVPVYGASRVTETVPPGDNEDLGNEAGGTPPEKEKAQ